MGTGAKIMIGVGAVLFVGTVGYFIYKASAKDSGSTSSLTAAQQAELDKQNQRANTINTVATLAGQIVGAFVNKNKEAEA